MALAAYTLPFGCRDIKLAPVDAVTGVAGTKVDLPVARTMSWADTEDTETLEGDDVTAASHGAGPTVDWELEAGGISIAAYKVLAGGASTAGASSATYTKLVTDQRPYFQAEGQAISDSGGDLHVILYRCKADGDLEGSFENGAFTLTAASGKGYGDTIGTTPSGKLYEFVQNETATAIS
jgi:hypothetical protein